MHERAWMKQGLGRYLSTLAAILGFVAQLAVLLAPIGEGRQGVGAPAHVDASGTAIHYAHNEATCASCQARSLHGAAQLPAAEWVVIVQRARVLVPARIAVPSCADNSNNLSRAPPCVI